MGYYLIQRMKENFYAILSKMRAVPKKCGEKLVYLKESIASVLGLWGGIMLSTLKGFLTSIWGCFTYLMSLILNTFLFIAAILTKILLDVCYWVIRKKTITSKKTDSLDDLPKPTSASTKTSRKRSKAGRK